MQIIDHFSLHGVYFSEESKVFRLKAEGVTVEA